MQAATLCVLRQLGDGYPHLLDDLTQATGLARRELDAAFRELTTLGLAVTAEPDVSVRLAQPFDALDADVVNARLEAAHCAAHLRVRPSCASTNTELLLEAQRGAASGTALSCEVQTTGRGRRGRAWHAPIGASLVLSMLWRYARSSGELGGLSLAVGVAVARALERYGATDIGLKWPNDLVARGAKLGGILIETQGEAHGATLAVVGVGLNTDLGQGQRARIEAALRRDGAGQPITDLAAVVGHRPDRNVVLALLIESLASVLEQFERVGFDAFRAEWRRRHVFQGIAVRLSSPGRHEIVGRAVDVDTDGALVLDTGVCLERVHVGEVTLRP
jgi:BirA family biotin operon repressor/biotin-[acetyl-CoA-carboxylase] ligase